LYTVLVKIEVYYRESSLEISQNNQPIKSHHCGFLIDQTITVVGCDDVVGSQGIKGEKFTQMAATIFGGRTRLLPKRNY